MLDNLTYGPHGYSTHEESFAVENEYQSNSGSLQRMPPLCVESPHYSKQHMSYSTGNDGTYPKYQQNGWNGPNMHQGGWYSPNGYYGPGGNMPGMHGHAPGRNKMMHSEYETCHADPGRRKMQNYGVHSESYDDYVSGVHNGHQKVEWKAV
ncbi:hypothetical protein OWV82_017098 [Melia azedarach]|uniref:Uncharacterized protein n=1 Tax=Melia azedarach TaxID=155640 RepID=A0ACC1XHV0_MELAZ|nr:hypothetical protein OWV82_017098 [Melia azedarach]